MITGLTLSDPARGLASVLKPRTGMAVQGFEFTPAVRAVEEDMATRDGALDTSAYLSSGAVTLTLSLYATTRALIDEIQAFCVPWARPYLVVTDSEWASPRQVQLRFDSSQHAIGTGAGLRRDVQYGWKAPRGLWEDTAVQSFTVNADTPDTTGLIFADPGGASSVDVTGYTFPASTSVSATLLTVNGNARPAWTARLYGPCTGPKLIRDDTGAMISFTDQLVLASGQYVELNSAALTANLLSDPAQSVLAFIDFTVSQWFPLDPGPNRLHYRCSSSGGGAAGFVTVAPVWVP